VATLTGPPDDPQDSPALVDLVELRREAVPPPSTAELDEGLRSLKSRLAAGRSKRRAVLVGSLLGVTVVALVAAAVRFAPMARRISPALEAPVAISRVEGAALLDGGYLSEAGHAGIRVVFNEGTEFALRPGSRGRLRRIAADGAELLIEDGAASFRVTPSRERRWAVEAGPFRVTVKGTVFSVSWDRATERFELTLRHGRVVVSGPVVGDGVSVQAGQRLVVSLPRQEIGITPAPAEESASAPLSPAVALADDASRSRAPVIKHQAARPDVAAASANRSASRSWAALLSSGEWDRILANVDQDGVDATLEGARSEDLFALADAARYRRRIDLARAALLAQRRRFPSSPRSLDAVFLLGRVEELRTDGRVQAIRLYDEYLVRAPKGAYAAEALGRKLILTNESDGAATARPIAVEYLRRFPEGSYAASARALMREP